MRENNKIPKMNTYDEMAEFWDRQSLADYWEKTKPAAFEVSPNIRKRYLVAVDMDIFQRIQNVAHQRGVNTESLVNLLLEQRLNEL